MGRVSCLNIHSRKTSHQPCGVDEDPSAAPAVPQVGKGGRGTGDQKSSSYMVSQVSLTVTMRSMLNWQC